MFKFKIILILPLKLRKKIEEELNKVKFNLTLEKIIKYVLLGSLVLSLIILLFFRDEIKLAPNFLVALVGYLVISYLISLAIGIFIVYSLVIIKKNKRKKEIESVLADYLQIVAANLNAGMPIDQALWYAVRERFGVLAEQVEVVARKVMGGIDLEQALVDLAKSYDSDLLNKAVILLIEGLKSGGEMAPIVNKIAWNIKETQLLEKEVAAETTTYTVFIVFAALVAAPALYSLSHRIILIMSEVSSKIDINAIAGVSTSVPLNLSGQAIQPGDFKLFAIVNLFITSIVSAIIISKIKKGGGKLGIKFIPFFAVGAIVLFLILIVILNQLFSNLVI